MNKKSIVFSGLLLLILGIIAYSVWKYVSTPFYEEWDEATLREKYPIYIGKLENTGAKFTEGFSLCNPKEKPVGFYHSSAPYIYKGTKYRFKNFIIENYQPPEVQDSGYFVLNFYVNCKGKVGNVITNTLDKEYKSTNFSDQVTDQLIELTIKEDHWNMITNEEKEYDKYMYIIYKIRDGKVVEILP